MRPLAGSGALSASFEAPLALRRTRMPPVIERASGAAILRWTRWQLGGPQSSWRASEAAKREAAEKANEAAGRGSESN